MIWFIIIVGCLLVAGIVFLSSQSVSTEKSREEFLREVAKLIDGKLEALAGQEGCYQILFNFEGQHFTYEDVEDKGFSGKLNKAYLKAETATKLVLSFTEKERKTKILSNIFIASSIPDEPIKENKKVNVPEALKSFAVHTNDIAMTNRFLEDAKVVDVLCQFKNSDPRGFLSLPFKIVDGVVMLEFSSSHRFKPNLPMLKSNVHLLENYLDQLLIIIAKLNHLSFQ